jgi:SAM-dependent methyltransferase
MGDDDTSQAATGSGEGEPSTERAGRSAADFFSGYAADWDSIYGGRNLLWTVLDRTLRSDVFERRRLTLEALGPSLMGRSLLDLGCGSGRYAFEAARRGARRVVGIDAALGMVELARRKAVTEDPGGVCRFVHSSFPPPQPLLDLAEPFDVGVVMGVMDYVAEPLPFLRALRTLITRTALLSFSRRDRIRYPIRRWRYRILGRCPVFHYERTEVLRLLADCGFVSPRVTYLPRSGGCYFVEAYV